MRGSTSCVHLVPDTQSAVIVLQNSLATNDTADLCCQALLEALLNTPQPNGYVAVASAYTSIDLKHMDKLKEQLESERKSGTSPNPATAYIGRYYNAIGNFCIEILEDREDQKLKMRLQDMEVETYALQHYYDDKFLWWMSYDEVARRGRYITDFSAEYYVLDFSAKDSGNEGEKGPQMETLRWAWDPSLPFDQEVFCRK